MMTNQIATKGANTPTMSSREIADLTGKDLSNVHRDIRSMLDKLKKDDSKVNHPKVDLDPRGYTTCFHLSQELTGVLLTGYSVSARLKVIRRWKELEEQNRSPAAALTRIDILKLALESEERRLELEQEVVVLAPKAEALDRLALAHGSFCIRDAAKALQVQEKILRQLLIESRWMYQRPGGVSYQAYTDKLQQGVVEQKITRGDKSDGTEWISTQVRITAKGLAKLGVMHG